MTKSEAEALVLFIKDHDTRFTATVAGEGSDSTVQLSQPDGTGLDPVHSTSEYYDRFIGGPDPGPTIRAAWEKWKPENADAAK
jgi:hypothetical protein